MTRDSVLKLRYMGVTPQAGHREYRFLIEKEPDNIREVCLTITDRLFETSRLMFQEAQDLCYQKLLAHLLNESNSAPIFSRTAVAATDIDSYRENHPTSGRKAAVRHHA
jgi:hypothetical protein